MSNLSFTDRDLMEMEMKKYTSPAADREPYHLTYARAHKGNEILNPHLPGNRIMAAGSAESPHPAAGQKGGEQNEQGITNLI